LHAEWFLGFFVAGLSNWAGRALSLPNEGTPAKSPITTRADQVVFSCVHSIATVYEDVEQFTSWVGGWDEFLQAGVLFEIDDSGDVEACFNAAGATAPVYALLVAVVALTALFL